MPAVDFVSVLPETADYVVVGGGAAGCVLAARLSEDRGTSVALLEAGGWHQDAAHTTPALTTTLWGGESTYADTTTPQEALGGRQIGFLTGRALGGGNAVNGLGWFHGHPADYDAWEREFGAFGWNWERMLSYLRRSEDHELGAGPYHGGSGPLSITLPRDVHPISMTFLAGCRDRGIPLSPDLNGAEHHGAGFAQSTIRDGARHTVVDAYLVPAADRENLVVSVETQATGLVVEEGRVIGVRLRGGGEIRARRSVVLTAGAFRSPQLLMLSGIGPKEHLDQHGTTPVLDLPGVGANLHDHPTVPVAVPVPDLSAVRGAMYDDPDGVYALLRRGPLTTRGQAVAVHFSDPKLAAPDLQTFLAFLGSDGGLPPLPEPAIMFAVALLTPDSRGPVRLHSADPAQGPLIDPGYLTHHDDRARLRIALRQLAELLRSPRLRELTRPSPQLAKDDDAALDAPRHHHLVALAVLPACGCPKLGSRPLTCRFGADRSQE
jgi:choline dehydrogenase-like flavoprotein